MPSPAAAPHRRELYFASDPPMRWISPLAAAALCLLIACCFWCWERSLLREAAAAGERGKPAPQCGRSRRTAATAPVARTPPLPPPDDITEADEPWYSRQSWYRHEAEQAEEEDEAEGEGLPFALRTRGGRVRHGRACVREAPFRKFVPPPDAEAACIDMTEL